MKRSGALPTSTARAAAVRAVESVLVVAVSHPPFWAFLYVVLADRRSKARAMAGYQQWYLHDEQVRVGKRAEVAEKSH
jgi:hypothetical protein